MTTIKKQDKIEPSPHSYFFYSLFYGMQNVLCVASSVQPIGRPHHSANPWALCRHSPLLLLLQTEVHHFFFSHSVSVVALLVSFIVTVYRGTRVVGMVHTEECLVCVGHKAEEASHLVLDGILTNSHKLSHHCSSFILLSNLLVRGYDVVVLFQ